MSNYTLFIHFSHCSTPFLPLVLPLLLSCHVFHYLFFLSPSELKFCCVYLPDWRWIHHFLLKVFWVPSIIDMASHQLGVSFSFPFFFAFFFFFFLLKTTQCCVMCKWKLWLSSPFLAALLGQAVRVASLVDTSKYVLTRILFLPTFLNPAACNGKLQVLESNIPKFSWCWCRLPGFY